MLVTGTAPIDFHSIFFLSTATVNFHFLVNYPFKYIIFIILTGIFPLTSNTRGSTI